MKRIHNFEEFELVLEGFNYDPILTRYGISNEQWDAMRVNPEVTTSYEKYKKYYSTEEAKNLVNKALSLVCTHTFGDPASTKEFMERLSKVESCYGTNPSTYSRPSQTKGLFQLDKATALKTIGYKNVQPTGNSAILERLKKAKEKIKTKLGIDWSMVPYESLSKPLYSALACRLYIEVKMESYQYNRSTGKLTSKQHPIPSTLDEQAKWWKDRYNTSSGSGTESKFKNPPGCSI